MKLVRLMKNLSKGERQKNMNSMISVSVAYAIIIFYITELICRKIERLENEIREIKKNFLEDNNDICDL